MFSRLFGVLSKYTQMQGAGSYSKEELAAAKFVVRGLLD
jgi:hypothetical protein